VGESRVSPDLHAVAHGEFNGPGEAERVTGVETAGQVDGAEEREQLVLRHHAPAAVRLAGDGVEVDGSRRGSRGRGSGSRLRIGWCVQCRDASSGTCEVDVVAAALLYEKAAGRDVQVAPSGKRGSGGGSSGPADVHVAS